MVHTWLTSPTGILLMNIFGVRAVLEHHLGECSDRYKAAEAALRRLEDKMEAQRQDNERGRRHIYGMLWTVAGTSILILLTALGTLFLKLMHP